MARVDAETHKYGQRNVDRSKKYKYVIVLVNIENDPAYCEIN